MADSPTLASRSQRSLGNISTCRICADHEASRVRPGAESWIYPDVQKPKLAEKKYLGHVPDVCLTIHWGFRNYQLCGPDLPIAWNEGSHAIGYVCCLFGCGCYPQLYQRFYDGQDRTTQVVS